MKKWKMNIGIDIGGMQGRGRVSIIDDVFM